MVSNISDRVTMFVVTPLFDMHCASDTILASLDENPRFSVSANELLFSAGLYCNKLRIHAQPRAAVREPIADMAPHEHGQWLLILSVHRNLSYVPCAVAPRSTESPPASK